MRLSSIQFDLIVSTLAGASYIAEIGKNSPWMIGAKYFAIIAIVDRSLRSILGTSDMQAKKISLVNNFSAVVIEESLYSGILLTQKTPWLIPRYLTALFTSMTATRALINEKPVEGKFSIDTKVGFIFASCRELILQFLPENFTNPIMLFSNTIVYSLAEIAPHGKDSANYPILSERKYKLASAVFFRAMLNVATVSNGILVPFVVHGLFNISRSLPLISHIPHKKSS